MRFTCLMDALAFRPPWGRPSVSRDNIILFWDYSMMGLIMPTSRLFFDWSSVEVAVLEALPAPVGTSCRGPKVQGAIAESRSYEIRSTSVVCKQV